MRVRLGGLTVASLSNDAIVIYSTHGLEPPAAFQTVWHPVCEHHRRCKLSVEETKQLTQASAVLVFCDTRIDEHMSDAFDITSSVSRLGSQAPPLILVHHSMAPELLPASTAADPDCELEFESWSKAVNAGMDDVIIVESCGGRLAAEVQARIMQLARQAKKLNDEVNQRREYIQHICSVEDVVHDIVWDYLRVRLRTGIPGIDEDIGPGIPESIDGLLVGQSLGEGSFGTVCRLVNPNNRASSTQAVLKIMDKKPLTNWHGIASLKRQIAVMMLLSSESCCHPNITKFFDVYHTDTHILFHMENGGPLDLYKRLILREEESLAMSVGQVSSMLKQAIDGLHHMHVGAQMVHRDIKPENMILDESNSDIILKYADFDTAQFVKPSSVCRGVIGTFPFMAPEVVLERKYLPYPADIWSLGVVMTEITCRLGILKKAVGLQRPKKNMSKEEKAQVERQTMERIRSFLSTADYVGMLLERHVRRDLRELMEPAQLLLEGMLEVVVEERMTAAHMLEASTGRFGP